jgi:hypothetical protein
MARRTEQMKPSAERKLYTLDAPLETLTIEALEDLREHQIERVAKAHAELAFLENDLD